MVCDREPDDDRNCISRELEKTTLGGNDIDTLPSLPKLQQCLSRQKPMTTGAQWSNRDATDISENNDSIMPPPLYGLHEQQHRSFGNTSNNTETSGMASKIGSRLFSSSSFLSTLLVRRTISSASTGSGRISCCTTARELVSCSTTSIGGGGPAETAVTCTTSTRSHSIFNRESGLRHHHQPLSRAKTSLSSTCADTIARSRITINVPAGVGEILDYQQCPHRTQAEGGQTTHTSRTSCLEKREASSPSFQADKFNTTNTTTTAANRLDGTAKGSNPYCGRKKASSQQQQVIMGNSFCTDCTHNSTTQQPKSNGTACLQTNGRSTIIVTDTKNFSSYIPFIRGPSLQDTVKKFLGGKQGDRQDLQNDHHHIKNLLYGCSSVSQHVEKVNETLSATMSQHGSIGLKCAGFEYRFTDTSHTRLFHIDTDTCITEENRQLYIADGCMYEEITRLAQETAQEFMIREGGLQWIDVCDKDVPIRALISPSSHNASAPSIDEFTTVPQAHQSSTFLITTGKGCVRAGIFSRKHLIVTGLEASTALPHIKEAKKREMRIVMIDPNARGDRMGMDTFELSMNRIFYKTGHLQSYNDKVYILAHSQAGAQLVRFLLDDYNRSETEQLKIKAIAFTDSTHNIQWTKAYPNLTQLLSGRTSIYLKSTPATGTSNNSYNNTCDANNNRQYKNIEEIDVGKPLDTDHYWKHRFGTIRTLSAGTSVHELVNWTGRTCIWEHFDQCLID